jgi:hypothetical protein
MRREQRLSRLTSPLLATDHHCYPGGTLLEQESQCLMLAAAAGAFFIVFRRFMRLAATISRLIFYWPTAYAALRTA